MNSNLNVKKLAANMSVKDMLKLLVADRYKRSKSENREWVLMPDERRAIYDNARKNNQIGELGKLIDKYNVVLFLWDDARKTFKFFNLLRRIGNFVYSLVDSISPEVIEQAGSDLLKASQRIDPDVISDKSDKDDVSPCEAHVEMLVYARLLQTIIYKIDYITKQADVELLPEEMSGDFKKYEAALEKIDVGKELTQLNDKDKKQCEEDANWLIDRFSRINFNTSLQ